MIDPSIKRSPSELKLLSSISARFDRFSLQRSLLSPSDRFALLIDFDGTLAEINPRPELTSFDPDAERAMNRLVKHTNVFVAVISGRQLSDLTKRTRIENITYSGNHGLEVLFGNGTQFHYRISAEVYRNGTILRDLLRERFNGVWVEDKNVSFTFHYRQVPLEQHENYLTEARALIHAYGFNAVQAHYAIEIKPPVVWSKGEFAVDSIDAHQL